MKNLTYSLAALVLISACGGTSANDGNVAGNAGTLQVGGNSTAGGSGGESSALGGQGGSQTGTGGASASVCTSASDCALADGCCTCMAYVKGQGVAQCNIACSQTACAKLGITASDVTCIAGRCVLGKSCDSRLALCNSAPPTCPAGQAPVVENDCFNTTCIPVDQCTAVTSCSVCSAAGLACVTDQINSVLGSDYHCISVPSDCTQNPTCECLGACEPSYQCASPNSTSLTCQCPTC